MAFSLQYRFAARAVGVVMIGTLVAAWLGPTRATPISMHIIDHRSVDATGSVIKSHLIAMYLPSIASGWLISRIGVHT